MPVIPENIYEAIVVGAGQAGLAASYHLKQRGVDHLLLDRGRAGEIWRTQRWDSFVLNTPALVNSLPGKPFCPANPGAFESPATLVRYFEDYIDEMELPFKGGVSVSSATRSSDGESIAVATKGGTYKTTNLVVATGGQNVPKFPVAAADVPPTITSIHASEYRNSRQLPAGAVLVVGSAQSGVQVAEDLLAAGRTVYLSTSKVGRFRRRFRGRDIVEWMLQTGMMGQTPADLENPGEQLRFKGSLQHWLYHGDPNRW
ncbi:MAG: NAD(P)/FAD-dependent oxidoreductase, partial [Chloroflexi bacterium]|nr:NAD(P)/FAD-dependent oxidoreductase [Chloroflexota bacterium]